MICPLCKKGEVFTIVHADGEKGWRCKWCGKLLSENDWEERDGRLVKCDRQNYTGKHIRERVDKSSI